MTEEKFIDPQWLIRARKNRWKFVVSVVALFLLCTVLAFWVLPKMTALAREVALEGRGRAPAAEVTQVLRLAGLFKLFWAAIALGCGAGILLALTGKIDNLLPVLNFVLLLVGVGAVAFTFYVYYTPALTLLEGRR